MPAATTPCPSCGGPVKVKGKRGRCPGCGQAVRFVDAPEVDCAACGWAVPILPGTEAGRCAKCGAWTADTPGRPVVGRATCPRCRRRIDVPLTGTHAVCPHCRSTLALQPTP